MAMSGSFYAFLAVFLSYAFALVDAAAPDRRTEVRVTATAAAGYPFGKPFSDAYMIAGSAHRRIALIEVAGCEPHGHLTGMAIWYRDVRNDRENEYSVMHGTSNIDQDWRDFRLDFDEYVKEVHVTTWDKKVKQFRATVYHTRIGSIRFTTSKGKVHQCGAYNGFDPAWTWGGDGKALLHFSGSQGDALDQLQAHLIPVADYF